MLTKVKTKISGFVVPLLLVVLWQLLIVVGVLHFQYIPTPIAIIRALGTLASSGKLFTNVVHTLAVTLIAWVIASVLGITIGAMIGTWVRLWRGVMASIDVLRSLPIIALVPVGVIIFGFTLKLEIVIAAYAAIWPVMVNTISGVMQTKSELRDLGDILHMSFFERLWKLVLPAATPLIIVGLRLGLGLSLVLAVVTEIVGTPQGVGYALISAEQALRPAQMFGYIIVVGIIGYLLNVIFMAATKKLPTARTTAENKEVAR